MIGYKYRNATPKLARTLRIKYVGLRFLGASAPGE